MDSFTVATLNIWNRFGPWEQRLPLIRAGIAKEQPDILTMQEVLRTDLGDQLDQAAVIADGFGYNIAYGRASDALYPFGNAILSKWPIVQTEIFGIPRGGEDENRNLLYAKIDSPIGPLHVFTTHLAYRLNYGHVRCEQIRFVVDQIERLAPTRDFPAILTGDMNADPEADEIRFLRGFTPLGGKATYFADCFAVAGDGSSDGTTFARRNEYAAVNREPDRRIDYVFVRGEDERYRGEPIDARVCFNEAKDGVWPSDHFGLIARIATR